MNFREKFKKNGYLFVIGMLIIPIINLLIFYFAVNAESIIMAFKRPLNGEMTWSFFQFQRLFQEIMSSSSVMSESLVNTLIFFVVGLFVINPLCLLFAFFFYKKVAGYKFFRFVFYLPAIISSVVLTTLYKQLLRPGNTVANLVKMIGIAIPELGFLATEGFALAFIVLYVIWTGFGVNVILFNGAMQRIPEEVVESANIDGISLFGELFKITIPMIWPTISTILTFAFVGVFTASGPILLFTQGNYGTYTIPYFIFELVYGTKSVINLEYASAVGLFFTAIGVPIVLTARYFINKLNSVVEY